MSRVEEAANGTEKLQEASPEREYLTFLLGVEEYAAPVEAVREIRPWEPVTRVPNAYPYEMGLVNVRGAIVPVIDLRHRLGLAVLPPGPHAVVIHFVLGQRGQERVIGGLVDALRDVLKVPAHLEQPVPSTQKNNPTTRFARGVVEYDKRMLVLLDLRQALDAPETIKPV